VLLELNQLYPERAPEPVDLKLERGTSLHGKRLFVHGHVSRFRNGSETPDPSKVEYKLIFEGGDDLIDEFTVVSDRKNPSDFNSFIQFNQL